MSRPSCAVCLVVILAACGGDSSSSGPSGSPQDLQISAGDQQRGPAGGNPPLPLRVVVTGADGGPFRGATVAWQVTAGGSSVSPTTTTTDANGLATTVVTLGPPRVDSVRATVGSLVPVTFQITSVEPCDYLAPFGPDTSVTGALSTNDCAFGNGARVEFYDLPTNAQGTLVITMRAATINAISEIALLYEISTRLVGVGSDGTGLPNSRLKAILRAGHFVAGATSFSANQVGSYTFTSAPAATTVAGCEEVWVSGGVIVTETITNADCATPVPGGGGTYYSDGLLLILFGGQTVTITQSSPTVDLDPYLTLLRVDQDSIRLVQENDDGGGGTTALLNFTADSAFAVYILDVGTALTNQTGAYTLSIGAITGPAPPRGLVSLAPPRLKRLDLTRLRVARPLRRR